MSPTPNYSRVGRWGYRLVRWPRPSNIDIIGTKLSGKKSLVRHCLASVLNRCLGNSIVIGLLAALVVTVRRLTILCVLIFMYSVFASVYITATGDLGV
jgi:hypothetical protein